MSGELDIVERLRARKGFWLNGSHWMMGTFLDDDCQGAADEIERLRAQLALHEEKLPSRREVKAAGMLSSIRPYGEPSADWP